MRPDVRYRLEHLLNHSPPLSQTPIVQETETQTSSADHASQSGLRGSRRSQSQRLRGKQKTTAPRIRTPVACERCRGNKTKCAPLPSSEDRVCALCKRADAPCIYRRTGSFDPNPISIADFYAQKSTDYGVPVQDEGARGEGSSTTEVASRQGSGLSPSNQSDSLLPLTFTSNGDRERAATAESLVLSNVATSAGVQDKEDNI
jgi:hypothetical protein